MPASGTPVASTITSISGHAISASASSVTCRLRCLSASPSEVAANCFRRPAGAGELAPRALDVEIGDADDMQAARQPRLRQEHGAELAGADQPDGDRPARGLAFEQLAVEIYESPR